MGSEKSRLETAVVANLLVMDVASNDWTAADTICQQAGIPRTQGRRAAARLAESGALQRRSITWQSGRSRMRQRFEYRLAPKGPDSWERLPAWMEPAWHPIDCTKARRITGRAQQLFSEASPVTDQDLYELPRGVRERFQSLSDDEFYDDPGIAAAHEQVAELEAEHGRSAHAAHLLHTQIAELELRRDSCRLESQRLADLRPRQIAEALLAGTDDLAKDWAIVEQIDRLQHFAAAVDLAKPAMDRKAHQANEATRQIAGEISGAQDHLRGLLDRAKLAEAERLAYA